LYGSRRWGAVDASSIFIDVAHSVTARRRSGLARMKSTAWFCVPRVGAPHRVTPRQFDRELYKARHLIENFFCKLKRFRAIATRYDKTARNFLAAIHLAAATIWLN
jgi:transposase